MALWLAMRVANEQKVRRVVCLQEPDRLVLSVKLSRWSWLALGYLHWRCSKRLRTAVKGEWQRNGVDVVDLAVVFR